VFEKITIKEYCERENISRTTADNRIKSGKIETIKEGRNRFVKVYKVNKSEFANSLKEDIQTPLYTIDYIKELKKIIKDQKREIKILRKELNKKTNLLLEEKNTSIDILKQYIGEVKLISNQQKKDDIVVSTKESKKKKKDKKSKSKRK